MSVIEIDPEVGAAEEGGFDPESLAANENVRGGKATGEALAREHRPTYTWAKRLASITQGLPFYGVHVFALGVLFVPFRWEYVAMIAALYAVRMFAVTAAYHRYFSHRAYKTSRWFQFVLAVIGSTALQKGVLWWAAHHRKHHRCSDQPCDIHSPTLRGILWAHIGWIVTPDYEETDWPRIKDFARYPELVWLNRWHLVPGIALLAAIFAVGGAAALLWAFFGQVILWHGTFTINSLSHIFGKVRYETTDTSKNNWLLALITFGEGWHNNHHYYPASANQGFFWWEVDVTYTILRGLEKLGLVWDLKLPPKHVLEGNRAEGKASRKVAEAA
jgi:stearoyl-CoA desaturase (delta-9 desaturase)